MSETFEVEVKVPITDAEVMKQKLHNIGAKTLNSEIQIDSYFDHPCRSFEESDEAIRVRTRRPIDDRELDPSHALNELTYKGPKIDKKTKTRLEYSVAVDDTETLSSILESIGFKAVATVTKKRTFYDFRGITISIDDVEQVGLFQNLSRLLIRRMRWNLRKKLSSSCLLN